MNSDPMELDSKVIRRPSSDIGPDTPINKLRLDEELSPSTENEFNGWLHDDLLQTLRANPDPTVRFILLMQAVNAAKPGAVILKDFHNFFVAQNFVGQHPHIKQFLQDGDFKSVLKSDILYGSTKKQPPVEDYGFTVSRLATENAWRSQFQGDADVLCDTLQRYMEHTKTAPYARYASFVQSSGTGKSRMNDELAKKIVYFPMNLSGIDVFPPRDPAVSKYILARMTDESAYENRMQAFLYGLFQVGTDYLKELDDGDAFTDTDQRVAQFASKFRGRMNEGMRFGQHGQYRVQFFNAVIAKAMEFEKSITPARHTNKPNMSDGETIKSAAERLLELLDPSRSIRKHKKPLVVLCFDESHVLTEATGEGTPTRFTVLRRALRTIVDLPIFSLFLSTIPGKLDQFASLPQKEPSSRLISMLLKTFPPICYTKLESLAPRLTNDPKKPWALSQVASTYHIAHLGRPLFGAVYDGGSCGFKANIVAYARMKLLRSEDAESTLTPMQQLACIAVRVPITFRPNELPLSSVERDLVADHLRILLYASAGFSKIVTTSASEPLVAEAACDTLVHHRWSGGEPVHPPLYGLFQVLYEHIQHSSLDLGTMEELVAAVLLLDARDRAKTCTIPPGITPPGECETPVGEVDVLKHDGAERRRIVTLPQFLTALIGTQYIETCLSSLPATYRTPNDAETTLETAFKDYLLYFNHFIKASSFGVINRKYLRLAMSRGAAIICAENQEAINIVIPCLHGTDLLKEKISVILLQIKNSRAYTTSIKPLLFTAMDPFECGVFDEDEEPLPIVRMVFSLASKEPTVTPRTGSSPARYTAYDIWCAGATEETFGVIQGTEKIYTESLLEMVRDGRDAARLHDKAARATVREMQVLASTEEDHWKSWADA